MALAIIAYNTTDMPIERGVILRPDSGVADIARKILDDKEYAPARRIFWYGLKGVTHVLLMRAAERLKTDAELQVYLRRFQIQFGGDDTPFTFNIREFINGGLLVPDEVDRVVKAFYRDNFNVYPGFDLPETQVYKQQRRSAYFLCDRKWDPSDFMNKDITKQGRDFGVGLWNNSVRSYEEFGSPKMGEEPIHQVQRLVKYYNQVIKR